VGSAFYDCIPVGAYSKDLATDAANAWSTSLTNDIFYACPGCLARQVQSLNGGGAACGVWCYDATGGYTPGTVLVVPAVSCQCPGSSSSTSTWQ